MKDSPKQMGSMCTRSAEPARLPFGQQNCPVMDSCAQGRAYRKLNHTQCLLPPPRGCRLIDLSIPQQTDRQKVSHKVSHHPSHIYRALQVHVHERRATSEQHTGVWGLSLGPFWVSMSPRCLCVFLQAPDTVQKHAHEVVR